MIRALLFSSTVTSLLVVAVSASDSSTPEKKHKTKTVYGRVVWMAEALARRHGVQTVLENAEQVQALETKDGRLLPIIEDIRGRSFRRDGRLRDMEVELLVREYQGTPMLQVIRICQTAEEGKFEIDYWCDICAIAMFELKPCDCCQGPIELRRRKTQPK